ncbi:MAG: type III secretion protein [Succinivibrionaceae bacterium]|nr:type III secretion protein [Succinivibrionaceae bacterium]
MPGYPLASLLDLRQHRAEEAEHAQGLARQRHEQSVREVASRREELEKYKSWREEEIERSYQGIFGKAMGERELEKFKAYLASLAMKQLTYEERVEEARRQERQDQEALDAACEETRRAKAAKTKLDEHFEIWSQAQRLEQERAEEKELEDFRSRTPEGQEPS